MCEKKTKKERKKKEEVGSVSWGEESSLGVSQTQRRRRRKEKKRSGTGRGMKEVGGVLTREGIVQGN